MSATLLQPDAVSAQQVDDILKWMEALAARQCSADDFLREVLERERESPDLPWEVLAQLDQFHRHRRIPHDVFVSLKARLQKESQHLGNAGAITAPLVEDPEFDIELESPPVVMPQIVVTEPVRPPSALPGLTAESLAPKVQAPVPTPEVIQRGPLRAGDLLRGRYRIVEILRRDHSGLLVEAVDEHRADVPHVSRRVAILVFDARRSREPELRQRLYRLQSLSHPCILRVFDIDEDQGELFATMEWLAGKSLQQLIASSGGVQLNTFTARTVIRGVASALAHAHARDIVHGDVNAANILVTDTGEIRLRGFELRGRSITSSPAGDRLAFAWLAYELLSGIHVLEFGNLRRARSSELRKPPGVTGEQWRVLRDTLTGREGSAGQVLGMFAGDGAAEARLAPLNAFAPAAAPRSALNRLALGATAAIVALAAWLFVDMREPEVEAGTVQSVAAAAQQVVPAPAAPVMQPSAPEASPPPQSAASDIPAPRPQRARLDLPSATVEVAGDQPFAVVRVRRRDNLDGTVSFRWWTETGSAVLNRDFLSILPRTEIIPAGDRGIELRVPLLQDPTRVQPRTFYVKIDASPGSGAMLGSSTLTLVTIVPPATGLPDSARVALPAGPQVAQAD